MYDHRSEVRIQLDQELYRERAQHARTNNHSRGGRLLLAALVFGALIWARAAQAQAPTAPVITLQPLSQTVNAGESATFNAAASGEPPPAVQWQLGSDATGPFIDIEGETFPSLDWPGLDQYNGWWFRAVFTNSAGSAATDAAQLTVLGVPQISQQPADQTVTAGQLVTFSAAASGSPRPSGNWQVSTDNGQTWTEFADNTESIEFQAAAADNGKQFRAIFTSSLGSATTRAAALTVQYPPVITEQPADQLVAGNQTAVFRAAASGNPVPAAQWQLSFDGVDWATIPGATGTTFSVPPGITGRALYRVIFANSLGSATSRAAALVIGDVPVILNQPADQAVNAGQTVNFSANGAADPPPTVQWQVSTDSGATWAGIPGATTDTLSFTAQVSDNGSQFRAVYTNPLGSTASNGALLTINTSPVAITQPANQTVDAGQTASFSAAAIGTLPISVQWQASADNGTTWVDIPGATTDTLSFAAQARDNGSQYRAIFSNVAGSGASDAATLLVTGPPKITLQPGDQAVNAGGTPFFQAGAIGSPAPAVQWQVSIDSGLTWADVPGATATTLSFTAQAGDNGKQFRALFSSSGGSTASDAANLVVNSAPAIITQPANQAVAVGQTAAFTAAAGGFPPPSPQWQASTDGGATWADVPAAIAGTLRFTVQASDNGKQYRAIFTNGLGTATTNAARLTVTVPPAPNQPPTVAVAPGGACLSDTVAQGTIALTVGDPERGPDGLGLGLVSSSNPALVPPSGVTFGGSGAHRTLTVTAARGQAGSAVLTLAVSDGVFTTTLPVTVVAGGAGGGMGALHGTQGPDLIFGLNGGSTLAGLGGNDLLCGGNGKDTLVGGDGDDTLVGGRGSDTLTGGRGADHFRGGQGKDTATDFTPAEGDTQDGTVE